MARASSADLAGAITGTAVAKTIASGFAGYNLLMFILLSLIARGGRLIESRLGGVAGPVFLVAPRELLAQLAQSDAPVARALDAEAARSMDLPAVHYDEKAFRWALNEDAMATEKLAEGIRAFAADAAKLDTLIQELSR